MRENTKSGYNRIRKIVFIMTFFLLTVGTSRIQAAEKNTAIVTIERLTIGEGYLLEPTTVEIQEGDTYADVFIRICEQEGIAYEAVGDISEGRFYVTVINNADNGTPQIPSVISKMSKIFGMSPPNTKSVNDRAPDLGEGSYHGMAGWQYSVNHEFLPSGLPDTSRLPKNGDVIRIQFSTYGYGADVGNPDAENALKLADKTELIRLIGQINSNPNEWFAIAGCKESYQKAMGILEKLDATQQETDQARKELKAYRDIPEEPRPDTVPTPENSGKTDVSKEEPKTSVSGKKQIRQITKILNRLTEVFLQSDTDPDSQSQWTMLGLVRSGRQIPKKYTNTFYQNVKKELEENGGNISATKSTEYAKLILSLTAIGKDVTAIGEYNLFTYLSDWKNVTRQGINGSIWALLAVDSHPEYRFVKQKGGTTRKKLIDEILSRELKNGGFTLMGETPDVDVTAMAVQALAPYYESRKDVKKAVDRAMKTLSKAQTKKGTFKERGEETAESAAQVLMALVALGKDPQTEKAFIKKGNSVIDAVLSYYITGKGFSHLAGGSVNAMTTEQCYYALVAYERMKNEKIFLYDMSDIKTLTVDKKSGSGSGKNPAENPDVNTEAGTGNGQNPEANTGTGDEQSPEAGTGAGTGNDQNPEVGPEAGTGNDQNPEAGTEAGIGNDRNPEAETEPGTGSGQTMETEAETVEDTEQGTERGNIPSSEFAGIQGTDNLISAEGRLEDGRTFCWKFYGSDILKAADFDTSILVDTGYENELSQLAELYEAFTVSQQEFPGQALLELETGLADGAYGLFRYDPDTMQAEFVQKLTVEAEKTRGILSRGGTYYIAEKSKASIEEGSTQNTEPLQAGEARDAQTTEASEKAWYENEFVTVLVGLLLVAILAAVIIIRKRNQRK